jgi:hypothetical protein
VCWCDVIVMTGDFLLSTQEEGVRGECSVVLDGVLGDANDGSGH